METDWKKKYEEALERMKNVVVLPKNDQALQAIKETVFPELAESEDERIRREIIDFICWEIDRGSVTKEQREKSNSWLSYLERQKDSPMPEDTVIFQKGVAEGRRLEREDLPYWQTFKGIGIIVPDDYILAKFGKGYKLLRPGDTIEIGTEFLQVSQLDNLPKEEQHKEQKPDIELIQRFWYMEGYFAGKHKREPKWIMKTGEGGPKYEENPKNGLPLEEEQKPEWSDEDEAIYDSIIREIVDKDMAMTNLQKRWLRSLKNRGNSPKSNTNSPWKPSEEQMRALQNLRFFGEKIGPSATLAALDDLYEQLEKLM